MHHQWYPDVRIGELKPCFIQEVTPGDTWSGRSTAVFRLAPLDLPTYMSLKVYVKFFFVPHSLTFPEFPDVITGSDTSTAWPTNTSYLPSTAGYRDFGIGVSNTITPTLNALPIRAFNQVYNDWFLNEQIETARSLDSVATARVRFPSSDYFGGITTELQQDTEETVDSSGATIGIPEIRDAWNRQRIKERRAQYGERYQDLLRSYGVRPSDTRLDRSEYVARGSTTIGISEVVATSTSVSGENTGEYRGHGIAGMRINFPKRNFKEHGTLIGVVYARPRLQLHQRLDKIWYVTDKEDLYHPELATDTMETVKAQEIYTDTASDTDFGYQARYEWLRTARDSICGNFTLSANDGWTAHVDLTSVPTVSYLQQVQDYDDLFQDSSITRIDLHGFFDHKIGKTSIIKPRRK